MGKKRKYEMMDEEKLLEKISKLQKVLNKKQRREEEIFSSPFRMDNDDIFVMNEDYDSIYPPPSDWAGTLSPSREQLLPTELPDQVIRSPREPSLSPQPGPSSEAAVTEPATEKDLDESILNLLGDEPKPETVFGSNIHKDVATRWQEILAKGLSKETKEKLISEYLVPANCDLLVPPVLNPEAKAALPESHVKRDFSLLNKQKQLAAALAALAQVTNMLISNDFSREKLLKPISDAGRLLCDSHQLETRTRRNFVLSSINHNLRGALTDSNRDKFLFGENLTEKLNAAKTIQKSGETLKNPVRPHQTSKHNFTSKDQPKGRLNNKALHPRQMANRFDAGQNRSAPYRAPPASRMQPPPPRRARSPPPSHPPPPQHRTRQHYRR